MAGAALSRPRVSGGFTRGAPACHDLTMGQLLLVLVVALTVAAIVFGVAVLLMGNDPGLVPVEPDGRTVPLPGHRPLVESDIAEVRFDTTWRGYRMAQVDQAMRRAAYDIGYKGELIEVLKAEVAALREGRTTDADALRRSREAALASASTSGPSPTSNPVSTSGPASDPERPTDGEGSTEEPAAGPVVGPAPDEQQDSTVWAERS